MAKNVMSTGIYIVTDPNDNIEKLCEVFRVTLKWKKDVKISHYKFPKEICFCSCEFLLVKNDNVN